MLRCLFLLLALVLQKNLCYTQPVISINGDKGIVNISQKILLLADTSDTLSFNEVISEPYGNKFIPGTQKYLKPGPQIFTLWCHFKVYSPVSQKLVIFFNNAARADLYFIKNNEVLHKTLSLQQPFHQRDFSSNKTAFLIDVPKDSIQDYYLQLKMNSGAEFPLMMYTISAWIGNEHVNSILEGAYIGCMVIMILYNFFIYFTIRDKSYLFYILYVAFMTLTNMHLKGLAFEFLWNSAPSLNDFVNITACLGGIFAILFTASFLHISQYARFLRPVFAGIIGGYFITIIFITLQKTFIGFILTEWVSFIMSVTLFAAGLIVYKKGYKPAIYYLVAWTSLLICIVIFVLKEYNILSYNNFTANSLLVGSAIEAMLLSLALANRISDYKKGKEKAQLETLVSLEENRKLIVNQNILLEKKVEERTAQLTRSNYELTKSFKRLKDTQSQLLKSQTEKLKVNYHKKLLELEAKALQAQMNPHFIFNCLNSIKALIQENENEKSVVYLTTFSKLIRTLFNNAAKREISLHDEIETCKLYLRLEAMRFDEKLSYTVAMDNNVDLKSIYVPALIIQPFIENAIWHGIIPKEEGGAVQITVMKENDTVKIMVEDNGIGRVASRQNKSVSGPAHQSKGINLTQSRLELDNLLRQRKAKLEIIDKMDEKGMAEGTTIVITLAEES
ncbi:MAG: 7TM diverse intracellular signaling domain-containing protein [Agriterribacter sp.]